MPEPNSGAGAAGGGEGTVTFNDANTHTEHVNSNWRDFVSKEYAGHSSTANIQTLNDLAKSYVNAQQMIGADKMVKPNDKFTDEDWKNYYIAGGMPESPDGYKLSTEGLTLPDGYNITDETAKKFAEWAHSLNLTQNQAQALWHANHKATIEKMNNAKTQQQAAQQEGWNKLRTELGQAFDTKIKNANTMLAKFDKSGEFTTFLNQTGLINHPAIAKFAITIADSFAEDKINQDGITHGALTPKQYRDKARELQEKLYGMNRGTPQYESTLEQYKKYQQLAAKE